MPGQVSLIHSQLHPPSFKGVENNNNKKKKKRLFTLGSVYNTSASGAEH